MSTQTSINDKYEVMREAFSDQQTFIMPDMERIFPKLSKATLYWLVSELVKMGLIKRIRRGTFAFNEWAGKKNISISKEAERLSEILAETGFYFYVSGLDILSKYMHHIPEQYPIMLFIEKAAREEIKSVLNDKGFLVFEPTEVKDKFEDAIYSGKNETQVVLYQTETLHPTL